MIKNDFTLKRWSVGAKQCYLRGCVCEGCFYNDFFTDSKQKCRMKSAVFELVKKIGAPCERTHNIQSN